MARASGDFFHEISKPDIGTDSLAKKSEFFRTEQGR